MERLGKTFTEPGSGFVLYQEKHTTNHLLVVGRRIGAGLDKIKLFTIFLRKSQSRSLGNFILLFSASIAIGRRVPIESETILTHFPQTGNTDTSLSEALTKQKCARMHSEA